MTTAATRPGPQVRTLGRLLAGLVPAAALRAHAERVISGITDDSRRATPGALFVAQRGSATDGRRFVADAVRRGAAVVLGEDLEPVPGAVVFRVADARAALATLAARWHDVEGAGTTGFRLIGITGTNGKSTSGYMAHAILRTAGLTCGLLGTVQYDLCGRTIAADMTTPGPLDLAGYVRECIDRGADCAVMEVSSHALDQKRTDGLRFAAAAFTNLTGDHLDYHRTPEAYRAAKARLFTGLDPAAVAVVNRDDPAHTAMVAECRARVLTFGLDGPADIAARITRSTSRGTAYTLRIGGRELELENALVGRHNVYNALTAAGLAWALGVGPDVIAAGLSQVRSVPGRLQRVPCASPADVFVDYAHTDDALRNVLSVLRPLTTGRLICVFGCGGDRDRTKRPRMARVVAEYADRIWVTSDNPRSEDPAAIIAEVLPGFDAAARPKVRTEVDRAVAIRAALAAAGPGDVVLLAGKGHETYQIIGSQRVPFDDAEEAIRAAEELRRARS